MDRYVADIFVPAPAYMPIDTRRALDEAASYGCRKGYWAVQCDLDDHGTLRPLGIRLIVEVEAPSREDAEDSALKVGLRFAQVMLVYSGSPLSTPKLTRLGRIGESDGLLEQYDYYYLDGSEALPRVMIRPYDLEKLLRWFGRLDEPIRDRLDLAARWYALSVGAQDPLDGYLAVWIGLEGVGPPFSERMHLAGLKAPCVVCGNRPGRDRKGGEAGIEHAIKGVAPEILQVQSLTALKKLRSSIVHGLDKADSIRPKAEVLVPDLQLCLIYAILTTARPETSAPRSGRAILPRNFKLYPEARAEVKSAVELIHHKPFFGEWMDVQRIFRGERTRLEAEGRYVWGAQTRIEVKGWTPEGAPDLEKGYVIFERLGRSWEHLDSDPEHPEIPVVPWRSGSISAAWARYLVRQEGESPP